MTTYSLRFSPYVLYSDSNGNIYEDRSLLAVGREGWDAMPIEKEAWIELPDGGNLYELPGRYAIGIDVHTGNMRLCTKGWAVAAFIPPAYTGLYIAAYETQANAPTLPLFCYTATGWYNNRFYVAAVRIENDIRQEAAGYNEQAIADGAHNLLQLYPHNRLVQHLMKQCCMSYCCPAAKNMALGRWECPVPSSPACNANCIGCISFQPEDESIVSTQERLNFKPTVEEIVEFTVPHLQQAPFPLVSFGQGCEGEPLLMWRTIEQAIVEIRKHTSKGAIHINTNGSNYKAVEALCKAGLNSIRVSMNSAQSSLYTAYYKPNNYTFNHIKKSLQTVHQYGGWSSINYFVFPGITDSIEEYEALRTFIQETKLNMIQWRNMNIDPDWYLKKILWKPSKQILGMRELMYLIQKEFPNIKFGYFNPPVERIKGNYETDYAHR
jgi:pyruvate-formate lyase-activating enzyme